MLSDLTVTCHSHLGIGETGDLGPNHTDGVSYCQPTCGCSVSLSLVCLLYLVSSASKFVECLSIGASLPAVWAGTGDVWPGVVWGDVCTVRWSRATFQICQTEVCINICESMGAISSLSPSIIDVCYCPVSALRDIWSAKKGSLRWSHKTSSGSLPTWQLVKHHDLVRWLAEQDAAPVFSVPWVVCQGVSKMVVEHVNIKVKCCSVWGSYWLVVDGT